MNPLKAFLEELEKNNKILISLNKSTIFCLDNEAFRFLCAYKSKMNFSKKDIEEFSESWRRSAEETKRLINQVLTVDPHNVIESIQLNEARETILTLTKPLADIAELIETNVKIQNDRKKEIEQTKAELSQLSKNLQIPQIYLEVAELGYPMTVCTSENCSTVQKISNTDQMQIIYKTVCHNHCYLEGIKLETFPQPQLLNCWAMNKETEVCRICGCVWSLHTHINFTQVKKTKMVEDENIKIKINNNEDAHLIKEQMIAECEEKIEKYKKEQAIIIETCTRFGSFLKANAILPYNDAFDAYVQQCIKEEERCVAQGASQDKLVALKRLLSEYRQEKEVLERSMKSSGVKVSVEEIKSLQQKLFSLEFTGAQIKQLFEANQEGHRKNDGYFEMHVNPAKYFHSKQKSSWRFGSMLPKMLTGLGTRSKSANAQE
uniref:DUF8206 domain-containing protein n=1 Tax=Acrobeloides nanus TaxID=290746 RepID=A0A914DWS4_9BILA